MVTVPGSWTLGRDRLASARRVAVTDSVVAIVDDGSSFATYLRKFLSKRGYETRSYADGDAMVAAIKQGDSPSVVLLDVMMPGMNGLATLRALKTSRADLQVIMMSGREQVSIIVEAVRLGAADYVVKPDDPDGSGEIALEAAIRSSIEKAQLVSEIGELRRRTNDEQDQALLFLGGNTEIQTIAQVIEQVSDSDVTVLIRGESGVGKELVARAIHERSSRSDRPFVKVNCAALPDDLLESELFGHEKGAFTGAVLTRLGKFEQADTGTIVLDEIGEMKPGLQAKLLHVLQGGQFSRLGSNKSVTVDVRVVAATNRNLEDMMRQGTFREDLYYRLKVIEVTVPPLRERRDEIPHLTNTFMDRYAHRYKRPRNQLSPALEERFMTYGWPGNIRELENMVKRIVILQDEQVAFRELNRAMAPVVDDAEELEAADDVVAVSDGPSRPLASRLADIAKEAARRAERPIIEKTLSTVQWNRRRAAAQLGVSYKTLLNKMKVCGISQP